MLNRSKNSSNASGRRNRTLSQRRATLALFAATLVLIASVPANGVDICKEQEIQQLTQTSEASISDAVWSTTCYAAGKLTPEEIGKLASKGCDARDVYKFSTEVHEALGNPDAMRKIIKALADFAGPRAVVFIVPELEGPVGAAQALKDTLQALRVELDKLYSQVLEDMQATAESRDRLERLARLDARAIQSLKQALVEENHAYVDTAEAYLTANPRAVGVRFNCFTACKQLIAAARNIDYFDNPTRVTNSEQVGDRITTAPESQPAQTSDSGPVAQPKHGHTGLIVGGVLAGTAAVAGAAVLAVAASCAQKEQNCTMLTNQCLNQHVNCSSVGSACAASCQCHGFSGFNVNTGSCQ